MLKNSKVILVAIVRSVAVFVIFLITVLFIHGLIGCDNREPSLFNVIDLYPENGCPDQSYFLQSAAPIVMLSPLLVFVASIAINLINKGQQQANEQRRISTTRGARMNKVIRLALIAALLAWAFTIATSWISHENLSQTSSPSSSSGLPIMGGCLPYEGTINYGFPFTSRAAEWGCIRAQAAQISWGGLLLNYLAYLGASGCLIILTQAMLVRRK